MVEGWRGKWATGCLILSWIWLTEARRNDILPREVALNLAHHPRGSCASQFFRFKDGSTQEQGEGAQMEMHRKFLRGEVSRVDAFPPLKDSMGLNESYPEKGAAICVVGGARTFRFKAIRDSLSRFASANDATLFFHISKGASCTGFKAKENPRFCDVLKAGVWPGGDLDAKVCSEFGSTHSHWRQQSSCQDPEMVDSECCKILASKNGAPGPYLQYLWTSACVGEALRFESERGARFKWIVRTRPDVLILDDDFRLDSLPTGSPMFASIYGNAMDSFTVSPRRHAARFYEAAVSPFEGVCGQSSEEGEKMARETIPENYWKDKLQKQHINGTGVAFRVVDIPITIARFKVNDQMEVSGFSLEEVPPEEPYYAKFEHFQSLGSNVGAWN